MMGGAFDGHPWTRKGLYGVLNEDPAHPIVKHLNGENFKISDELYMYKDYDRQKLRVLLSIDMNESYKKAGRKDHDHALAWVKKYGKGRVFYTTFGHNESVYADLKFLQLYLNGIQYALGDLDVDTTPLPQPESNKNFQP